MQVQIKLTRLKRHCQVIKFLLIGYLLLTFLYFSICNVIYTDDLGVQLVIVEIADQNDNGPRFTKKLYTGGKI